MKVLIACECSGRVRAAFRRLGHDAWSCDTQEAEDGSPYHIQGDVLLELDAGWDLMIAHPPCTRLTNTAVRWLHVPPKGRTLEEMWEELDKAAAFYVKVRDANIPSKAIENPIMHRYARERIAPGFRQVIQPWWFGEPTFKATGLELINLPMLVPTNKLIPPAAGTEDHKKWSWVHRMPPGPNRAKDRSRTTPGVAAAMAVQWGGIALEQAA
jgi:hypothetical protein